MEKKSLSVGNKTLKEKNSSSEKMRRINFNEGRLNKYIYSVWRGGID